MGRNKLLFLLVLCFIINITPALATITFTGGKWESTFDCAEYVAGTGAWSCDGIDQPSTNPAYYVDGHSEEAVTAANNLLGGGGRGLRHWIGDGQNVNTSGVNIKWPTALKELWVRMYFRYPEGFNWDTLTYHKWMYFQTALNNDAVVEPSQGLSGFRLYTYGGDSPVRTDFGFQEIMGRTTGDGVFHCVEVYLKMDTVTAGVSNTDGAGRVWIDGVLIMEDMSMNFSQGDTTRESGWTYVGIPSNQAYPANGQGMPFDVDDIVIYNTTPPGRDASGNPYIGPIPRTPLSGNSSFTLGGNSTITFK